MEPIQDHLKDHLDVVFVGFNPSIRSSETGHHFANPNNRFWKILFEAGITPRKYLPEEDSALLELGYGLTNIVARPTKSADEITKEEYKQGKELLQQKILKLKPLIVCFVGKGVYQEYSGKRNIPWGTQESSVVPGTIDYVAPSSSGLVRMRLNEIIDIYKGLANLIQSVKENKANEH
ncbi:DNA glycosylase [Heyndrickxia shackletonii]|uniref:DNA glycosylase n=1 Tax=Heyndrickxia shackletonii TaxID=157838 RepID=A0A0Q3TJ02_9BACI|nr:mismatch-specific DNA-glycosylase [Heyndrickxia shackletonii]KQL53920.1 DNA glycosylase [Heyndrickxia shackletonii]MBB2478917.1 mismatch-specific DNA-glycosylase [Bacillus sp. APMAM]NEY97800.1 mismatch-specific DNA-glycosylase [Heyndrickxia shackletonii]RTZ57722.1 mismatch-specific DNA-glycosylase [Bacillus sp. SAJ1]